MFSRIEFWLIIIVGSIPPIQPLFLKGFHGGQAGANKYPSSRSRNDSTKLSEFDIDQRLTGLTSTVGRSQPRDSIERMLPAQPGIAITKDFTVHRGPNRIDANESDRSSLV